MKLLFDMRRRLQMFKANIKSEEKLAYDTSFVVEDMAQ